MINDEYEYNNLDCPYTWDLIVDNDKNNPKWARIIEAMDTDIRMNPDIEVTALIFKAYLIHRLKNETKEAGATLRLAVSKCDEIANKSHQSGLKFVIFACMAWLLRESDMGDEVLKIVKKFDQPTDGARAAIYGARAYTLSYCGKERYAEGLKYYKLAYSSEKTHFGWPLGIAILAGRLRRIIEGSCNYPTELEEDCLDKAITLSGGGKALPYVFLADITFARGRGFRSINLDDDEELLSRAAKLYETAYWLAPKSSHVLKRCGKAFSVMRDSEKAEKYLHEAIAIDPNSSACLHRLGQFYEYTCRDYETAKLYYEKAVAVRPDHNLYAELDVGRIKKRLDPTFDVLQYYTSLKNEYKDDPSSLGRIDNAIEKQIKFDEDQARRAQEGSNRNARGGGNQRPSRGSQRGGFGNKRGSMKNNRVQGDARNNYEWGGGRRNNDRGGMNRNSHGVMEQNPLII